MKNIKMLIALILTALALVICIPVFAETFVISPAFDILAGELKMVKTGLVSNDITFTAEDFDKVMGVDKVKSITVTSLPLATEGKLYLGTLEVMKNQKISRNNLSMLRYTPNGTENSEAVFTFTAQNGDAEYSIECMLYTLTELNYAPALNQSNDDKLMLKTQKDIAVYANMKGIDPENDKITFEVVKEPKKGKLSVLDDSGGNYKYTPNPRFTGKDSFKYVIKDKYGNCSDEITVNIIVEKPKTNVVYSDMNNHWAHYAAIRLAEENIMVGEKIGNTMAFNPEGSVTRCEFLVMAMNAIGCDVSDGKSTVTVFADDGAIPTQYKKYVAEAYRLGYISGVQTENGLYLFPNNEITRAEAAVMLNSMLDPKEPVIKPTFADETSMPVWAEDAIYALNQIGIFNGTGEGYISPMSVVTRAQTAQILCAVMDLE